MTHYHIAFHDKSFTEVGRVLYENIDDCIIKFLDLCFEIRKDLKFSDRSFYLAKIFSLIEEPGAPAIVLGSDKLSISIMRCEHSPCNNPFDN
jgi:hypothetical protein